MVFNSYILERFKMNTKHNARMAVVSETYLNFKYFPNGLAKTF